MSASRQPLAVAGVLSIALATLWAVGGALVGTASVRGSSMQPLLEPGDRLLIDRWTYRQRPPLPGEVLLVLARDGRPVVKRLRRAPDGSAEGLWVEGDNSLDSEDSRRFGALPASSVRGRVVFRYWPLSRVGSVGAREPQRADDFPDR